VCRAIYSAVLLCVSECVLCSAMLCCLVRSCLCQVYFANHPSKFAARQANTTDKTFEAFLMYSANYDPHTHTPNPPNSAYHMNLQQARFSLSSAFATKLDAL
jgi:hypothetical protein